jgi:N-acetylneuraminate synthase
MAGLPSQLKGYSGHELGTAISIAAVALGACYIERHFTSDKTMWGSDQAMSLEPHEFKAMVDGIREVEAALGNGQKRVYESAVVPP